MDSNKDRLLDHHYDGIQEYDNPLPGWWTWLFVASIVFSIGYYAYYQLGAGPTVIAEYDADVRAAAERQAKLAPPPGAGAGTDELRAVASDPTAMAKAKEIFGTRCMPCHGPEGQGVIGPNLADDYWIHGRTLADIRRTIHDGVIDKGMVPWKDQLSPKEIDALAAYVGTLAGTNPPNPKPPQGVNGKGESAPVASN